MITRTIRTVIAAALIGAAVPAAAAEIGAAAGSSVSLGTLSGVAYYTQEAKGYRVVVTLAPRAAAPAVRFEAVLAPDSSVTLSTPNAVGGAPTAREIARVGDRVVVSEPGAARTVREAAALN